MKFFTELFVQLDRTNKTNEKLALLKHYFSVAPDRDKVWALALFSGRRPPRKIKSAQVQQWALERAGIPEWLFRESYHNVGDLAETVSLILPITSAETPVEKTLSEWFNELEKINKATDDEKKDFLVNAWKQFSGFEIFVFNKLLMGSFRIGVSQTLVVRAIAEVTQKPPAYISHRIMGNWDPFTITFDELIHAENTGAELSKPYPFYLAYAIDGPLEDLGQPQEWQVEWKWDGIRSQVILRGGELFIWSRGEELVTDKFPELHILKDLLPDHTVLDGELICITHTDASSADTPETAQRNWKPLPFNILQTRISRKNVTKKILQEAPVAFIAYDVMEAGGIDVRDNQLEQRRTQLQTIYELSKGHDVFKLSPLLNFQTWDNLKQIHERSRDFSAEGFMLKRKNAPYLTGRKKGDCWKWKTDPLSVDAVMIYAQKGHGRRSEVYSDYTFAVWNEGKLVPFAKAYSGLTDNEINEVDRFVKKHTLEKFGPVRTVTPELVFEIGFEGINASPRHKSGIAVRFPRILRWRKDKTPDEADTLDHLKSILALYQ